MGVGLRRLGIEHFTIFEQGDGLGGTWHDNVYPGAEVDTPGPFYSFSFHPFDFTCTHVTQPELLRYLQNVADTYQLGPHLRFSTRVERAEWDDTTHDYEVHTSDGRRERFDVVVTGVGLLNHPNFPDWPGLDRFRGEKFHSSRWDASVDLTGKRVAVVGTGSTSAQLVPAIAPRVGQLSVFQRQPGWIIPKGERNYTPAERALLMRPWYRRWQRAKQAWAYQFGSDRFVEGRKGNVEAQQACEAFIEKVFKDRPDLQKMVTPDYPFGGKRPVKDSNFYPALLRDNVELVPRAVTRVTETSIVDDLGDEREIDVLIMCTGFQAANYLATIEVVGRDGRTLREVWNGEPEAYLGLTVSNFPNFYMLYGPNTNGFPIMFMHERQVEFVLANLKRMITRGVTAIEVRKPVMDFYNRVVQRALANEVPQRYPEVHNYARTASGRNVIAWGGSLASYAALTRTTARLSASARRRARS